LGPWEMGKKLKYVEIIVRDSDGFKKISRWSWWWWWWWWWWKQLKL
jgi:hypothetical protein